MKRIITMLVITLALSISFESVAQLSRREEKEWKKRLKKTTPQQYKNLLDENKSIKSQVSSLRSELDKVDDQLAAKDEQINQYAAQTADLRDQLAKVKSGLNSLGGGQTDLSGVVFKVQIGAYRQIDLSSANSNNFGAEKGDVNKYTIGVFRDYWEADTFKKYIKEMGVKDAFLVGYRDGRRVADISTLL